jgi:hypothetical protein
MNVIKRGSVGEHGLGVKVRWGSVVSRKKGTPKGFWGVAEGLTKFSSPPREKHSLFAVKELTYVLSRRGEEDGSCVRVRRSSLCMDLHSSSNEWFMGQEPGGGL